MRYLFSSNERSLLVDMLGDVETDDADRAEDKRRLGELADKLGRGAESFTDDEISLLECECEDWLERMTPGSDVDKGTYDAVAAIRF